MAQRTKSTVKSPTTTGADYEQMVLDSYLSGAPIGPDISEAVFSLKRNKVVFNAIKELKAAVSEVTLIILVDELIRRGQLEEAGGPGYVAALTNRALPGDAPFFEKKILEAYRTKTLWPGLAEAKKRLEKGDTLETVTAGLTETMSAIPARTGNTGGFKLMRLDSIKPRAIDWLIKGMVEIGSFGTLFGDTGSYKSFFEVEMAACVATGVPFFGRDVRAGPVVYLAAEGQSGLSRRFKAWSIARDVSLEGAPLFVNQGTINLIDPASIAPVIAALDGMAKDTGTPPALIIIDTWSRALGGDDSSPRDAAAGVAVLDTIRARYGCSVITVHHEGYTKGRARGWSGNKCANDFEFRMTRLDGRNVRIDQTKSKDSEPLPSMFFKLAQVELSFTDDDGNPVSSAVLNQEDCPDAEAMDSGATNKKLPGKAEAALVVLGRLEKEAWNNRGLEGAVSLAWWREECEGTGISKQRFYELKRTLEKNGDIKIQGLYVSTNSRSDPASPGPVRSGGTTYPPGPDRTTGLGGCADKIPDRTTGLVIPFPTSPGTPPQVPPEIPPDYADYFWLAYEDMTTKDAMPPDKAFVAARDFVMEFLREGGGVGG